MPYDVTLGRIKLPSVFDSVSESIGDEAQVVGDRVFLDPIRARPLQLTIPVYGAVDAELDPYAAGDRLRRQVRELMSNTLARREGVPFVFDADRELDSYLVIGGGDVSYADGGPTMAEYQLQLRDTYVVATARSHRLARISVVRDMRQSTVSRDPKRLVYSTVYSYALAAGAMWLPTGAYAPKRADTTIGYFKPTRGGSLASVTGILNYRPTMSGPVTAAGGGGGAVTFEPHPEKIGDGDVVIYDRKSVEFPRSLTNMVANPRFRVDTSRWFTSGGSVSGAGATLTRVTNAPGLPDGFGATLAFSSVASQGANTFLDWVADGDTGWEVQPQAGDKITAVVYLNPGGTPRNIRVSLGDLSTQQITSVSLSANVWTRVVATYTCTTERVWGGTGSAAGGLELAILAPTTPFTGSITVGFARAFPGAADDGAGMFDGDWPGCSWLATPDGGPSYCAVGKTVRASLTADPREQNFPFTTSATDEWSMTTGTSTLTRVRAANAPNNAMFVWQVGFDGSASLASFKTARQMPGWTYQASVYVKGVSGQAYALALSYNAANVASTSFTGTGAWQRVFVTAALPVGIATTPALTPVISQSANRTEVVQVACPMLEPVLVAPTTVLPYFDGESARSHWSTLHPADRITLGTQAQYENDSRLVMGSVKNVDPQSWGWEEVYGEQHGWDDTSDFPVLQNDVVRVRWNRDRGFFAVDAMGDYGGWVPRARIVFRPGNASSVPQNPYGADVPASSWYLDGTSLQAVEWTPERGVVRVSLIHGEDRLQLDITLQRGWDGPRFDGYRESRYWGPADSQGIHMHVVYASQGYPRAFLSTMDQSTSRNGATSPFISGQVAAENDPSTTWALTPRQMSSAGGSPTLEPTGCIINADSMEPAILATILSPKGSIGRVDEAWAHGSTSEQGMSVAIRYADTQHVGGWFGAQLSLPSQRMPGGAAPTYRNTSNANATQQVDALASTGNAVRDVTVNAAVPTVPTLIIPFPKGHWRYSYLVVFARVRITTAGTARLAVGTVSSSGAISSLTLTQARSFTSTTYIWMECAVYLDWNTGDSQSLAVSVWQTTGAQPPQIDRVLLMEQQGSDWEGFIYQGQGNSLTETRSRQTMVRR